MSLICNKALNLVSVGCSEIRFKYKPNNTVKYKEEL